MFVGAQKNRLNKTILFSTQIILKNLWRRKLFTILGSKFLFLNQYFIAFIL